MRNKARTKTGQVLSDMMSTIDFQEIVGFGCFFIGSRSSEAPNHKTKELLDKIQPKDVFLVYPRR